MSDEDTAYEALLAQADAYESAAIEAAQKDACEDCSEEKEEDEPWSIS